MAGLNCDTIAEGAIAEKAPRALGAGHVRILLREILPNVLLPVLAYSFIIVAIVIVLEGG
ncbi:MAG: hypothetical protein O7E56_12640 [SAR324 cluster bacterium]|nr:hypothetical protein [SAR324 cluster bacterium]